MYHLEVEDELSQVERYDDVSINSCGINWTHEVAMEGIFNTFDGSISISENWDRGFP